MRVWLGVLVGVVGCSSSGDSPPIVEELADPCVIDDVGSPPSAPVADQLFDRDMDAHVRGADGAWDLGAYEH